MAGIGRRPPTHRTPTVVVGVDGSSSSLAAVRTAADEAERRGCTLRIVHAFLWPATHPNIGSSPLGPAADDGLSRLAMPVVRQAAHQAHAVAPRLKLHYAVVIGDPATVLMRQSHAAELLVVGNRGLGGFRGLLAGSVALHLASHAPCPLLVVRGRHEPTGDVLLGVDGSVAGEAAVGFAFAEAALRGTDLTALHAWQSTEHGPDSQPSGDRPLPPADTDALVAGHERVLAEALSPWQDAYPQVTVHRRPVHAPARSALIEASAAAQLAVVGARGRGGFTGLLLGSVSHALLHHAHCPVAIIRHPRARADRSLQPL